MYFEKYGRDTDANKKKKTTVVETELDNAIQKIIFSLNTLK